MRHLSAACVLTVAAALRAPLPRRPARTLHAAPVEPPQTLETDCLVVGGGISGCTLAHNLKVNNVDCLLAEQRDYLGGNVKSHTTEDGFTWEEFFIATGGCALGVVMLGAALTGYFVAEMRSWHRWLLGLASILVVAPGMESGAIGVVLALPVLLLQLTAWQRNRSMLT